MAAMTTLLEITPDLQQIELRIQAQGMGDSCSVFSSPLPLSLEHVSPLLGSMQVPISMCFPNKAIPTKDYEMYLSLKKKNYFVLEYSRFPTPVFLPGKSHSQRSLAGCSTWGCKELDMTEYIQPTIAD